MLRMFEWVNSWRTHKGSSSALTQFGENFFLENFNTFLCFRVLLLFPPISQPDLIIMKIFYFSSICVAVMRWVGEAIDHPKGKSHIGDGWVKLKIREDSHQTQHISFSITPNWSMQTILQILPLSECIEPIMREKTMWPAEIAKCFFSQPKNPS